MPDKKKKKKKKTKGLKNFMDGDAEEFEKYANGSAENANSKNRQ